MDNSGLPVDNLWITLLHRSKNTDFGTNRYRIGTNGIVLSSDIVMHLAPNTNVTVLTI